jgi:hypothetical protein
MTAIHTSVVCPPPSRRQGPRSQIARDNEPRSKILFRPGRGSRDNRTDPQSVLRHPVYHTPDADNSLLTAKSGPFREDRYMTTRILKSILAVALGLPALLGLFTALAPADHATPAVQASGCENWGGGPSHCYLK